MKCRATKDEVVIRQGYNEDPYDTDYYLLAGVKKGEWFIYEQTENDDYEYLETVLRRRF